VGRTVTDGGPDPPPCRSPAAGSVRRVDGDERPAASRPGIGVDVAIFVAAACTAAGVVHLALAPGRFDTHAALGAGFVAVAIAQLAGGALVLRRPGPRTWAAVSLGSLALIGAWLAAHLAGVPVGPDAWERERIHAVDLGVLGFEALTVLGAVLAVLRPDAVRAARAGRRATQTGSLAAALLTVATAVLLVSPGALDAPGTGAAADDGAAGPVPSTRGPRVEGLEDMPGATLVLPGGSAASTSAPGASSGAATGATTVPPAGSAATTAATAATAADGGFTALLGGRREVPDVALDRDTRARIAEQLAATSALVVRHPTLASAEAAGYRRAGPFAPGTGTPLAPPRPPGNLDGRMDPADLADAVLLYDGTTPTARLAGFLYLSTRTQTDGAPEGFAGPNDRWTYVGNICTVPTADPTRADTPLGVDRAAPAALCTKAGGTLQTFAYWTLHVWTVPGYESGAGVFRDVNASITCPDGSYRTKALEELGSSGTLCRG
jgi:hypothetical protein